MNKEKAIMVDSRIEGTSNMGFEVSASEISHILCVLAESSSPHRTHTFSSFANKVSKVSIFPSHTHKDLISKCFSKGPLAY